jgi:hypothetical protein
MCELQRLGYLANQAEADVDGKAVPPLTEKVIEPYGAGIVPEDERGTQFMLGELLSVQDPIVVQLLQKPELTLRRTVDQALRGLTFVKGDVVDSDTPLDVLHGHMRSRPFLIGVLGTLEQQVLQNEIPDFPGPLGRANANLLDCPAHRLGRRGVDAAAIRLEPDAIPVQQGGHDALLLLLRIVSKTDTVARRS